MNLLYTAIRLSPTEIALQHREAPLAIVMREDRERGEWVVSHSRYPDGRKVANPSCFRLRPEGYDALASFLEAERGR